MNLNPTLIHAQALAWVQKKLELQDDRKLTQHQQQQIELRVYDLDGAGYYVIFGHSPAKWYYDNDPTDGHFGNTTITDVMTALVLSGKVQIVGARGTSYGIWKNWTEFEKEVLLQ